MKKCIKCCEVKEVEKFRKNRNKCNQCLSQEAKEYRKNNKEKIKLHFAERYKNNPELRKRNRDWYHKNKEKNKEKIKIWASTYREKYREEINLKKRIYHKNYRLDPKNKEIIREKRRIYNLKRRTSTIYRLSKSIRVMIYSSLRNKGFSKGSKTFEILGCSFDEFKLYLESKFEPWMTWENRGLYNGEFNHGWDIDHIIPVSYAKTEEELIKLNHYTNLQPLCSRINRDIKKNKLNYQL